MSQLAAPLFHDTEFCRPGFWIGNGRIVFEVEPLGGELARVLFVILDRGSLVLNGAFGMDAPTTSAEPADTARVAAALLLAQLTAAATQHDDNIGANRPPAGGWLHGPRISRWAASNRGAIETVLGHLVTGGPR